MRVMGVTGVAGVMSLIKGRQPHGVMEMPRKGMGVTGVGLAAGQLSYGGDKTHCRKNRNRTRDEYYKHRFKHVVVIVTRQGRESR